MALVSAPGPCPTPAGHEDDAELRVGTACQHRQEGQARVQFTPPKLAIPTWLPGKHVSSVVALTWCLQKTGLLNSWHGEWRLAAASCCLPFTGISYPLPPPK